jgi:hypothetical protein
VFLVDTLLFSYIMYTLTSTYPIFIYDSLLGVQMGAFVTSDALRKTHKMFEL